MFDGRTHLVKQGWKGTGHPLKAGGRSRPVVIAQKKTLGGIGKDRDESFAFWDHLYDVAAKTVKLKLPDDGSSTDSDEEAGQPAQVIHRTRTGIPSNRRPTALPTPSSSKSPSPSPQPTSASLITLAKREAARRVLYSRFSRGPVITQETLESELSKNDGIAASVTLPVVSQPVGPSGTTSRESVAPSPAKNTDANGYAEKAAKEERKKSRVARRQAKEERRLAKAARKEARAAKRLRKVERAAKKAAKLEKKQQLAPIEGGAPTIQTTASAEHAVNEVKANRKEKKRKRDEK